MTNLGKLREQVEENRAWAFSETAFGSSNSKLQFEGQVNAYDLVLMMIDKLNKHICKKCGGTVWANHGRPQCINCGAYHNEEGDLIETIDGKDAKVSKYEYRYEE